MSGIPRSDVALLKAALEKSITRLEENPFILFTLKPDYSGGLNAAEINRLAARPIFGAKDDSEQRLLIVNHPNGNDPVEWLIWHRVYGREVRNDKKLERTVSFLRAWQEWAGQAEGGSKSKHHRGRKPDPDIDPAKDKRLCEQWRAAKRQKQTRQGFCDAHGIQLADLIAAMDREKYRKTRDNAAE